MAIMGWLDSIRKKFAQSRFHDAARSTIDSRPPQGRINVFASETDKGVNAEQVFREIGENDLYQLSITELVETLVVSNGTAARLWDDFVTFSVLDYELTCEDARGQQLLDDFRVVLDNKRNPFDFTLRQIFSQVVLRGNYCFELILDDDRNLSNFVAVDPDLFKFLGRDDPVDGTVYDLVQYDADGKPVVIDSPLVYFEAINALPGKRKGTALIGPAMPAIISNLLVMQDLRKVVSTSAFLEKYWSINHVELKKAGYTLAEIAEIVSTSEQQIGTVASNRDKTKVPVVSAEMELKQYAGATVGSGGTRLCGYGSGRE